MEAVIHWANNVTNWDQEAADKRACLSQAKIKNFVESGIWTQRPFGSEP